MTTEQTHTRFIEAPPRRRRTLADQLKAAGDDCWRSAQLVVFFLAAAVVFSGPPAYAPIFTPAVSMAADVRGVQTVDVRPVAKAVEPAEPAESAPDKRDDLER